MSRTGTRSAGERRAAAAAALAWRSGPWIMVGFLLQTIAAGSLPVAAAWLTKFALDGVVDRAAWGTLLALAAGLVAAGTLAALLPHIERFLGAEQTRRAGLLAMDQLYAAVGRFAGLRRFEDPDFHDRLRLARESAATVSADLVRSMIGVGQGVLTGAAFIGSMLVLSPVMTAAVLLTSIPAVLAERRLADRRAGLQWDISPAMRRELFYAELLTEVRAAKEVRAFGIGAFLRQRMLTERRSADAAQRHVDLRAMWTQGALSLLLALVAGAGLVWAIHQARGGAISVGDVSMFVAAVASAQGAVSQVVADYALARESLLLFDQFLAVLRAEPDLPVVASPKPAPALRQGIEFRDVWFRYTSGHPWVLREVDLRIPQGTAFALVGANGAGKTTLVKLLCRFYDPTQGAITWDGVDLRELDPADLRDRIGTVFQDYMEYDLTAAENIGVGDVALLGDRSKLRTCAEIAGIHDTLSALPYGYDTLLSRMFHPVEVSDEQSALVGAMLSTGQWQRLALARALLRDGRDLLILDEPSSGLDAEAEHQIHTMLRERRHGRTSLLISHRLGAVRQADRIAVIADGRIAEEGDHAALMALGGRYARLFSLQASGYHDDKELSR